MDKQKRENLGSSLLLIVAIFFIFIAGDWLWRAEMFPGNWKDIYRPLFLIGKEHLVLFKAAYLIIVALMAYSNPRRQKKNYNKLLLTILTLCLGGVFIIGYTNYLYFNIIIYPLSFFIVTYTLHELIHATSTKKIIDGSALLSNIPQSDKNEIPFSFKTEKGLLHIPSPGLGIYLEGAAGSGKSVNVENLLYQATQKGYAGVLYDYEGNPLEHDGAALSRVLYSGLKFSSSNVKFAFLNFNDLTKSVRCNPISSKYLKNELDVINVANTLMKNLEKEWVSKTDFWASNAINVTTGALLKLRKLDPKFCTIPHLISFMLSDFRAVLNYLSTDEELAPWIMPVMSAYKQEATQQTAGVISSAQLPLTKLFVPEIFWNLAPPPDEEFNLDITNPNNPTWFCIANNPKQKQALSPVIALVLSICMEQMNQFGRIKSIFAVDELPTIYIPNLDTLPATARKHGVITLLTVQTFKQLEEMYGKNNAEITRDNLSNQFIGKTNSLDTAKRISEMFGEYEKVQISVTTSDGGESQTESERNKKFLQAKDITQQKTGHWTGFIANAEPPFFHAQFDYFTIKKLPIPAFSKKINTGDPQRDSDLMKQLVRENFVRIKKEVDELLAPYMPSESID